MKFEKTDLKILEFLVKDINKEYSIKQIADLIKKPYVKVHSSIQRLIEKGIIEKRILGRSHYCKIDYKKNIDIVCFIESLKARRFLEKRKEIKIFIDSIKEKILLPDYSLVVFGSYAEGKEGKKSDLDIASITSKNQVKKISRVIDPLERISSLNVHQIEFSYDDFIKMLNSKEMNVGKEILKKHIIIHGSEQFYECVKLSE